MRRAADCRQGGKAAGAVGVRWSRSGGTTTELSPKPYSAPIACSGAHRGLRQEPRRSLAAVPSSLVLRLDSTDGKTPSFPTGPQLGSGRRASVRTQRIKLSWFVFDEKSLIESPTLRQFGGIGETQRNKTTCPDLPSRPDKKALSVRGGIGRQPKRAVPSCGTEGDEGKAAGCRIPAALLSLKTQPAHEHS
jgi:hypothetical protein